MKRLSVIIPGYNTRKEWWIRCVRSVVAALGPDDRVVCVDDGSVDPVQSDWFDLCQDEACAEIVVIRHKKNLGLPSARNTGLDVVTDSRYVTFVDSDDEVRAEAFNRCIAALEKHSADLAVYGLNSLYVNDGFQVHDIPEDKFYGALNPEDVAYLVRKRLFYYSWNKVFRMAFLEEHQLRFYPEGVPCEDAIFNVGLVVHKAKWVTVAYEGYKYYRYDGSLLSSYKPTYMAGTRACTHAWRAYKDVTPGAYESLGSYDETSDADIIRGEWTNIWRRRSPYGLAARWRFAREHKAELGKSAVLIFIKKAVVMWGRAHLYIKPLRRWHSKRFLVSIGANVEPLKKPRRFVAVMNIPAPYRIPLFEEMYRQLSARGIDYKVYFMSHGHRDRPKSWLNPKINAPYAYCFECGPFQHEFNPGLVWHLLWHPPYYMDLGSPYDTFTCVLLALFCRTPVKIMVLEGNTKTPGRLDGVIGWYKRFILKRAAFLPVPGSDARKFIGLHQARTKTKLGPTPYIPNIIDQTKFHPREFWQKDEISALRVQLGVQSDEIKVCLIPARFDPVKGLIPFFETVDADMLRGWRIVILGHGRQKDAVVSLIARRGFTSFVTIVESVAYELMPKYYAAADLFLLPSIRDMNPLCVVEALFSGLPIALSDRTGNVEEGVTDGLNGWSLPVMESGPYRLALQKVFATPLKRLREMGRYSFEHNSKFWDMKPAVKNYLDAIVGADTNG